MPSKKATPIQFLWLLGSQEKENIMVGLPLATPHFLKSISFGWGVHILVVGGTVLSKGITNIMITCQLMVSRIDGSRDYDFTWASSISCFPKTATLKYRCKGGGDPNYRIEHGNESRMNLETFLCSGFLGNCFVNNWSPPRIRRIIYAKPKSFFIRKSFT